MKDGLSGNTLFNAHFLPLRMCSNIRAKAMAGTSQQGSGEPRPVEQGALYTVEERLETFRVAHCSWPFDSGPCTPLKMAEAGFYFCGTDGAPDWVRCVVCHHDMEGWEATDDPKLAHPFTFTIPCVCVIRSEHKKHVPNCGFLKIKDPYRITVENVFDLEKKALETFIVSN